VSQTKRKKAEPETKTTCDQMRRCKTCERVSEAEHIKLQDEIILWQNRYAVNTARGIALEKRLEAIKQHWEQMPKENQSIYWTSICDDEIQDEFIGHKFFTDLQKWYQELGVLLSPKELDQKTREGDSK